MNLQNLLFSWQFNSYSYFKASTEVLSNWAVETLGSYNMRDIYVNMQDIYVNMQDIYINTQDIYVNMQGI
jgi:hypothetical protein